MNHDGVRCNVGNKWKGELRVLFLFLPCRGELHILHTRRQVKVWGVSSTKVSSSQIPEPLWELGVALHSWGDIPSVLAGALNREGTGGEWILE
jgi:hypothetical protein